MSQHSTRQMSDDWGICILGLVFTVIAVLLGGFALTSHGARADILNNGVQTTATVAEIKVDSHRRSHGHKRHTTLRHHPVLIFTAADGREQRVEKNDYDYDNLRVGDRISIFYMPDSPWIVEIEDAPLSTIFLLLAGGASLFGFIGLAAISAGIYRLCKRRERS